MTNLIGQSLGRYHILEQLGEGGMATVYKAYDTRLERDVAIKVIRVDQFPPAALERILKRFEREAKALARLTHPNIVHINDYGEHGNVPYLVMDYLPGGTLKERMKGKPMPWQEAVRLLIPIASALDFAHEKKVIHRDVKPANILLTEKGQSMLSDFGIAKILELDEGHTLTGTGMGVGTPEYMSPEQGLGKEVDGRADIYSMGIIFYELITGRKPYSADTPMAVILKHTTDPLPRPRQFLPNLPEAVERVLLKALAKDPKDRYPDAGAFANAMESLISGSQTQTASHEPTDDSLETMDTFATNVQFSSESNSKNKAPASIKKENIASTNLPQKKSNLALWIGLGVTGIVLISALVGWLAKDSSMAEVSPTITPFLLPSATVVQIFTPTIIPTKSPTTTAPPTPAPTKIGGGGKIAFASNQDGDYELYTIEPDGTNLVQLTDNSQDDFQPSWSYDGTKIVFASGDYSYLEKSSDIYILDLESGQTTQVTNTSNWYEYSPTWSPDGKAIAYLYSGGGAFGIRLIEPDGSGKRDFVGHLNFPKGLRWSPLGYELHYSSFNYGNDGSGGNNDSNQIISTSMDGVSRYLTTSGFNYFPSWAPDGNNVAFMCSGSKGRALCVMSIDGQNKKAIYDYTEWGGTDWSPDGRKIIFTANNNASQTDHTDHELYIINADGTDLFRLTDNSWEDTNPAWYWPK